MATEIPLGRRIRFYREQRGRTQRELALHSNISPDYLSEIERSVKVPTIEVVARIAAELEVSTPTLLDDASVPANSPARAAMPGIQLALLRSSTGRGGEGEVNLDALRRRVDLAWDRWQNSTDRFTGSLTGLADLIVDVEQARHAHQPAAASIAANLYMLLQQVFKYNGWINLAIVAADRGALAAEESGDPVTVAAGDWCLGHMLRAIDEVDGAVEVASKGIERLRPHVSSVGNPAAAMVGSLELAVAFHTARQRNLGGARQHIESALELARHADGDGPPWIVFSHANVHMHAVAIELECGRAAEGFRMADHVDLDAAVPVERGATYLIDLCRLHNLQGNHAGVMHHLLRLEEFAPEDVLYRSAARDLVRSVATAAPPTYARDARKLARRVGIQV